MKLQGTGANGGTGLTEGAAPKTDTAAPEGAAPLRIDSARTRQPRENKLVDSLAQFAEGEGKSRGVSPADVRNAAGRFVDDVLPNIKGPNFTAPSAEQIVNRFHDYVKIEFPDVKLPQQQPDASEEKLSPRMARAQAKHAQQAEQLQQLQQSQKAPPVARGPRHVA